MTLTDFEDYVAGRLDEEATERLDRHVDGCDACRISFERFKTDQEFLDGAHTALRGETVSQGASVGQASSPSARAKAVDRTPNIDGYRITGVIGQGGMGIVYRAVQTKLNRTVALKVLPTMVGAASPSAVARFRREAKAAARLHHTHIVPVYDFGESPDAYYYAMELISGQPLNLVIRSFAKKNAAHASAARLTELLMDITAHTQGTSSESAHSGVSLDGSATVSDLSVGIRARHYYRQVAVWMADAADALHYAHTQNIIHRDVKPGNLILSTDGQIMIADFGLAKSIGEESFTMTGSLLGTVRYLSPEQAMARRIPVDHRTDVYSLGATMYELLCFQPAYPGDDEKQVLSAIITRDPTPPRKIATSVPPELETICLKALEKDSEARFPTARALAEDLRRYTQDLPIEARRPGPVARAVKFVKRHKAATLAAALSVGLAVTIFVVVSKQQEVKTVTAQRDDAEVRRNRALANQFRRDATSRWEGKPPGEARWAEAGQLYGQAMTMDPDNYEAPCDFARMKKEQYNASESPDPQLLRSGLQNVRLCLQLAPEPKPDPNTILDPVGERLRLADLKRRQMGRWNLKGVLHMMLDEFPEAIAAFEESLALDPDDADPLENIAAVYALIGDMERAESMLLQAADRAGSASKCATIWCTLASIRLAQGDSVSVAHLERALKCKPGHVWSALIRARLRLGLLGHVEVTNALDDAKFVGRHTSSRAVKLGKSDRLLGLAYLRNNEPELAIEHAKRAIAAGDMPCVNQLVISIGEANQGHWHAAQSALLAARTAWPVQLQVAGALSTRLCHTELWIDTADELLSLEAEAKRLIAAASR